jgi:hypothetical protein
MGFKPRNVSMLCGFYRTLNPSPKTKFAKAENLRVKGRRPFSCCQIAKGACLELGESRTLGTNGRYITCDRS